MMDYRADNTGVSNMSTGRADSERIYKMFFLIGCVDIKMKVIIVEWRSEYDTVICPDNV
jgi:hypothetical protein